MLLHDLNPLKHSLLVVPQRVAKPLFRGWLHALAAFASLGVSALLVYHTAGDLARMVALSVFGFCMCHMYIVSATLHLGNWREHTHRLLCRWDYAGIFLKIAGTYTPICVVMLDGWFRVAMLTLVWLLALVGAYRGVWMVHQPSWMHAAQYLGLGWLSVCMLPALYQAGATQLLLAIVLGGAFYTLGSIVYARRSPDPWPSVFGFHELFHLCVILGSSAFVVGVWSLL